MDKINHHPLISVIMPAYNAESYINDAIQSILDQTYSHFELLICDDGSKDNTVQVISSFQDNRIKFFKNEKNLGNLKTTNFLLSKCRGEYIAIQDADDISIKNRFELCIAEFSNDRQLGLIGTNFIVTDALLNHLYCGFLPLTNQLIQNSLEKEVPPFLYASIIVKRELVETVGFFRLLFNRKGYADLDWLCRICEITKVKNLKEVTYLYRKYALHENSPRNLIAIFGAEIIIEAHKQRLNGEIDFIDTKNVLAIRKFIGLLYLKKGEQSIWNKNYKQAKTYLTRSLIIYPLNLLVLKNLMKVIVRIMLKNKK